MSDAPEMPFSIPVFISGLFLGLCCLFPYNSFLSSPTYLEHYFQYAAMKEVQDISQLPVAQHANFWDNVSNWATVMMLVPMALSQCLMMLNFMLRLNLQIRMLIGATLLFVAMLLIPVVASGGGVSEGGAIAVVLIACILTGLSTSVLQSSCYALFGTLPTVYVTAFCLGGGLSGSVNSVIRIIIHYSLPTSFNDVKKGAVIFYSINMALMVLTCVTVFLLRYSDVVKQCCKAYSLNTGFFTDPALLEEAMGPTSIDSTAGNGPLDGEGQLPVVDKESQDSDLEKVLGDDSAWSVTKRIWLMMLCIFMCMLTTLTYFPGMGLKAMKSSDDSEEEEAAEGWGEESVTPMVIILMYNAGDTVGRFITFFVQLWLPRMPLVGLMVFRIFACMIPLILGNLDPKVIDSNANPIVVFAFLGLTNGYIVGIALAYGCSDESLKTESEHATAGTCMAFALLIGCSVGSVLALLIVSFAL